MFDVDLQNSGIEVVLVILAYFYTFVLTISMITECPLLDFDFLNQDRHDRGKTDHMETLLGT